MNHLEAMQIYVRVAELAGFTRAAESLGLPKASASTAVRRLETLLGTQLLHRTTRRVRMTDDGRAFYERARDLLADMEELQCMFRREGRALRGRLRVDMPGLIARNIVIPRLPELLQDHPELQLELGCSDRRVDLVREGYDCVLRVGAPGEGSFVARPLGRYRVVTCASPAYLARHGVPRTLEDLASHRLVHYVQAFGARPEAWEYWDGARYASLVMDGALTVNTADAYQAACLAGLGMVQVPLQGARALLDAGELVEVLPQYAAEPMPVSLLYPHRRNLSPRVRIFMDWLGEAMRPYLEPAA
ncbi:LysR family transcriptional regulator [Luteimonas sp. RD2P54]|uniref:LysR family transcriptional regulator n=1 Tax=Luteimonas endophytica TaxID=3042023 RepID=A0ABT6JBD0_9GAMM|nr:LysR family transcriptional regulator [Luteimonas endophytica]MDH5824124.1 LysR family transcriptional regulator [Luteimonas endophytica]